MAKFKEKPSLYWTRESECRNGLPATIKFEAFNPKVKLCLPHETRGILNKRDFLEYYVKVSMFRFKFELYGYALNFCVKYNIKINKITKREDWSVYGCYEWK